MGSLSIRLWTAPTSRSTLSRRFSRSPISRSVRAICDLRLATFSFSVMRVGSLFVTAMAVDTLLSLDAGGSPALAAASSVTAFSRAAWPFIGRWGIARARGRFFGYSLLQRGLFPQQSLDFRVAIAVAQPESADLRANALQLRARPLLGRLPWLDRRTGRRILRRAPPGQILQPAHAVL